MTVYYRGLSAETQLLAATLVESGVFKLAHPYLLCFADRNINRRANGSLI